MSFLGSNNSKLALVIGINYTGMQGQLNGCINDTVKIINFLKSRCGYLDQNIILLTDESEIKPETIPPLEYAKDINNIISCISFFIIS